MKRVKNSLKAVVRTPSVLIHRTTGRLFPALKCYFVRSVHRHVGLSNFLHRLIGKPPLDGPLYEECHPLFACLTADCRLNIERLVKFGIHTAKRHPTLYQRAQNVLYRFPGLSYRLRQVYHKVPLYIEQEPAAPAQETQLASPQHPGTSYEETVFLQLKAFMQDRRK